MSYDGWLQIDTGGPEPASVAELGNYTSNVAGMWALALREAGEDIRLSDTDRRTAGEVLPLLRRAVAHMEDHPGVYRAMNPASWGNYEGALDYLRGVVRACAEHPKAHLRWWV